MDGFTYSGVPLGVTCPDWLELLRAATPRYAAQPYQQFAAAHKAMGQESDVRRVLIAQRKAQLASDGVDAKDRVWERLRDGPWAMATSRGGRSSACSSRSPSPSLPASSSARTAP